MMNLGSTIRQNRDIALLMLVFLLLFVVVFRPWSHGYDPMGYYSWLRSVVIDADLNVTNEFEHYGFGDLIVPTATGYTANAYNIGVAVLWAPFFLIIHAVSLALNAIGLDVPVDGYGRQYTVAVSIGSTVYAFIGLLLSYHIGRRVCSAQAALIATVGVWAGTGVLFYMYMHPGMSHANDIFVNSLVIAVWFWTHRERSPRGWFALGFTIGLATLVRQQNAILVLFPVFEWLVMFVKRPDRKQTLFKGVLFAAGGLLIFGPQFYVWYRVNGTPFLANPYLSNQEIAFNWLRPAVYDTLFSINRSLYFYAPIFFFGTIGLWPLRRYAPRLALFLFFIWLLQVYISSAWPSSGGATFGRRVLLNGTPCYLIGLTALVQSLLKRGISRRILWGICIAFIVWNFLLIAQYITDLLSHVYPPESAWTVISNQVVVIGEVLERFGELMARRFEGHSIE